VEPKNFEKDYRHVFHDALLDGNHRSHVHCIHAAPVVNPALAYGSPVGDVHHVVVHMNQTIDATSIISDKFTDIAGRAPPADRA